MTHRSESAEVEVHKRYSTCVDDLQAAFVFVFDHADEFRAPRIEVQPITVVDDADSAGWAHRFDVSVSGHVKGGD